MEKLYTLIGSDGKPYKSPTPGTLGGYKLKKIYGRLDCPNALRWIAKGHYVKHRVFFADEETAIEAEYHPCSRCQKEKHRKWKQAQAAGGTKAEVFARYRLLLGLEDTEKP